jgi:hypothetical protein
MSISFRYFAIRVADKVEIRSSLKVPRAINSRLTTWGTVPKLVRRDPWGDHEYAMVPAKITLKQRYYEGGRELGLVNYMRFVRRTRVRLKVNEIAEISKLQAKNILKEKW